MRACAYARYSTDHQTENSIAYQMDKIQKYCSENGITLIAFYSDEAQSGTNMDRPGFQSMISAAKRHEFDAIVIYDISRGSRDVGDWFHFRKQMAVLGIQVISANQNLGDFSDPNNFLVELINVGLGQHMVLDARKKSMDGVAEKAKQGVFLGGIPPLGYDIVNGEYIINDKESEIVKKIFSLYADGCSYEQILCALNGAPGKRGRPIGKNSLNSILKNERYIGTYTWNKRRVKLFRKWAGGALNPNVIRIENAIPKIIDEMTWEKVQKRMSDNSKRACNKAKQKYLLSGLIECAKCGATYIGHTSTNKKGYQYRSYVCGNKYRTHTCDARSISANEIESFVIQNLKAYLLEMDFDKMSDEIIDQINSSSADLRKERKEIVDIETKIKNGMNAILGGANFPELSDEIERLRMRKSELEDIIATSGARGKTIKKEEIKKLFQYSVENWNDENIERIVKMNVTKIYANADGSFSVHMGVHLTGCGGRI